MSDDILLATGEHAPIQETTCDCGHGYYEHTFGTACEARDCTCPNVVAAWDDVEEPS